MEFLPQCLVELIRERKAYFILPSSAAFRPRGTLSHQQRFTILQEIPSCFVRDLVGACDRQFETDSLDHWSAFCLTITFYETRISRLSTEILNKVKLVKWGLTLLTLS